MRTRGGTNTDTDGAFSINAEEGDKLEATYIGLSSQTITFSGQASLKFTLAGDIIKGSWKRCWSLPATILLRRRILPAQLPL
ncbi:hypothetical protein KRR40_14405 [Niabella defluvii]|nr:hypothetical protein KRR40_14405 [Niabella sp. I65]